MPDELHELQTEYYEALANLIVVARRPPQNMVQQEAISRCTADLLSLATRIALTINHYSQKRQS